MKVYVGGDISVVESKALFAEQKTKELFNDVVDVVKDADEFIVNLECAVTDKDTPIKKFGPNLAAPFGTCEILKEMGVTLCAISNNHIFDFGKAGMKDTFAELEKNGLPYTGFGENEADSRKNYYIKNGGKTIAVVNVCEHEYTYALENRMGARPYDPYDTNDDIVEAKKNADFVIVIYHGGKEHVRYPSPRLVKACRSMVKHGADVVLCQHSHCIGCEEYFEGGYILYGQGNFHFVYNELNIGETWNTGLLICLHIQDKITVERIPIRIDGLGVKLAKGEDKERIISQLEERSKSLLDGTWKKLWREGIEKFTHYRRIIPNEKADEFAHVLDCEAHTDVLREIYTTWNLTNEVDE